MAKKKAAKKKATIGTTSDEAAATPTAEAKLAEGKNKSEAIREVIKGGVTKPKEIVAKVLEQYQIEVGTGLVNQVKQALAKKGDKPKGKRGRKPKAEGAAPKAKGNQGNELQAFGIGLQFVKAAGGLETAKAILDAIEQAKSL